MSGLITKAFAGFLAFAVAQGLRAPLLASLPYSATHTLSDACQWQRRPWAALVGADERPAPVGAARVAMARCEARRGQKSTTPFLKVVLKRWPSPAELAAISRQEITEDAKSRSPLPAQG